MVACVVVFLGQFSALDRWPRLRSDAAIDRSSGAKINRLFSTYVLRLAKTRNLFLVMLQLQFIGYLT